MANLAFSWELVDHDIRIQHKLATTEVDMTWSAKPPRCEYIAESNGEGFQVYFFAGLSIDIAEALLEEISGELNPTLLRSLEQLSKKEPQLVVRALIRYLTPPKFHYIRIFCVDQSYRRLPRTHLDKHVPSPKVVLCDPVGVHTNFTPEHLLEYAHAFATDLQMEEVNRLYNIQWKEMRKLRNRQSTSTASRPTKEDPRRDRLLWVAEHGPVSPKILDDLVSRFGPKKTSTIEPDDPLPDTAPPL
ncbi:gibberellin 2-oxidase [Fonsecaea nubica]|uniref:Gibberellin 2-oxidase n=1 Tax=Fonsecaea nubica TaxID=856822 RepID=A0A178BRU6_9EURO|nr:gibberellin 2-oxidase [Fonsecaea nubica]OAL19726.1 gibberellin 2-oxidase [Fonsecaea nubica]